MAGQALRLGADNWKDEVETSAVPVLVDFWAAWCGPCRMVAPAVEAAAQRFQGRAKVGKLDVDAEPELAARFGVFSIPTLLIFRDGQVVDMRVGALSSAELDRFVEGQIATAASTA